MTFSIELKQLAQEYANKSTSNLARWKPPMYINLVEATNFLTGKITIPQRLYHVTNELHIKPLCKQCQINYVKWIQTYKPARYADFCSNKCASMSAITIEKRKTTNLEKYGVESYSQTQMFHEQISTITKDVWQEAGVKRKLTNLDKYGIEYAHLTDEAIKKRQNTNLIKFGHTNILASEVGKQSRIKKLGVNGYSGTDKFREKRKQTMFDKYGVEYSGQSLKLLEKNKATCLGRYGSSSWSNHHLSADTISKLNDANWLNQRHNIDKMPSTEIAKLLGVDKETVNNYMQLAGLERTRHAISYPEQQLSDWLKSYNIEHIMNDRKILNGKELDIVIPSHKIAIEYCGLYWHSTAHKMERNYHLSKLKNAEVAEYRLITIFEDEWIHHRDIVLQKLSSILQLKTGTGVYARKCVVSSVSNIDKVSFFNTYHIQGDGPSSINIGLYDGTSLVACMGLIKHKAGIYTLNRYATSCRVIGGFTKLLSYFKSHYDWAEIISFADRRWSRGELYSQTGWVLDTTLPPDYYYVDIHNIKRIHKFNFRHKNLPNILGKKYDPTLSETENTEQSNWFRIYNCGLLRYVLTN